MILPIITFDQVRAVTHVFGKFPCGNCYAWLELSAQHSPIAALARRGMDVEGKPSGWLIYYSNKCSSNTLTAILRGSLDKFNSNPVYITVHWYQK